MKNIIVGQSGGPTAVINSSIAGVYKKAKELGVEKVYGMVHGIEGFLEENIIDLGSYLESEEEFKLELKERLLELKELLDKNEVLKNEFDKLCEQYKAYNFDFNDWNNEYFNISDDKHYDIDNDKDFALEMTNKYKIK